LEPHTYQDLITYGFYGMITLIGGFIAQSINKIKESIESLSSHVAVLIARTDRHDKDIERLDGRIERFDIQCDMRHIDKKKSKE
jgi:hypothetical protein